MKFLILSQRVIWTLIVVTRAANESSRVEFWTYRAELDLKMGELEFELELNEPIRIELELDSTKKSSARARLFQSRALILDFLLAYSSLC